MLLFFFSIFKGNQNNRCCLYSFSIFEGNKNNRCCISRKELFSIILFQLLNYLESWDEILLSGGGF